MKVAYLLLVTAMSCVDVDDGQQEPQIVQSLSIDGGMQSHVCAELFIYNTNEDGFARLRNGCGYFSETKEFRCLGVISCYGHDGGFYDDDDWVYCDTTVGRHYRDGGFEPAPWYRASKCEAVED